MGTSVHIDRAHLSANPVAAVGTSGVVVVSANGSQVVSEFCILRARRCGIMVNAMTDGSIKVGVRRIVSVASICVM